MRVQLVCGTILAGPRYMTVTFRKNPKIPTPFGWNEDNLAQQEPIHPGSVWLPFRQDMAPR